MLVTYLCVLLDLDVDRWLLIDDEAKMPPAPSPTHTILHYHTIITRIKNYQLYTDNRIKKSFLRIKEIISYYYLLLFIVFESINYI
jgi:hypothetical protein